MKVDNELRAALNLAEKGQQSRVDSSWEARKKRKAALAAFLKSGTANAKKLKKAIEDHRRLSKQVEAADKVIETFGVSSSFYEINDENDFRAAGGVIPEQIRRWKAQEVIAELLAAKPADRSKVLAKFGINWE